MKLRLDVELSLDYHNFRDNPIPLGDTLRTFLHQFSPPPSVKPHLSSCSSSAASHSLDFSSRFFPPSTSFLSEAATPESPGQPAVYANDLLFMLQLEWDLKTRTAKHSRTHTHRTHSDTNAHLCRLTQSWCFFYIFYYISFSVRLLATQVRWNCSPVCLWWWMWNLGVSQGLDRGEPVWGGGGL